MQDDTSTIYVLEFGATYLKILTAPYCTLLLQCKYYPAKVSSQNIVRDITQQPALSSKMCPIRVDERLKGYYPAVAP